MEMLNIKSFIEFINEDAPVNNVGAGNVAGIVTGETPPVKLKITSKPLKRKALEQNDS